MNEENKRVAGFAIAKMFEGKFFDICVIQDVLNLMHTTSSNTDAYNKLRLLHCVDWGEIPEDIFKQIPVWLNEVFDGSRQLDVSQISALREGNNSLPFIEDVSIQRIR